MAYNIQNIKLGDTTYPVEDATARETANTVKTDLSNATALTYGHPSVSHVYIPNESATWVKYGRIAMFTIRTSLTGVYAVDTEVGLCYGLPKPIHCPNVILTTKDGTADAYIDVNGVLTLYGGSKVSEYLHGTVTYITK